MESAILPAGPTVDVERSFGEQMSVDTLKKGLSELLPDIRFNPGGNLNLGHLRKAEWMGVYVNDRWVATMDRGPSIPEYLVYSRLESGQIDKVERIGWRHTLERITRKTDVTWDQLCKKFRIEYKKFNGHHSELL